MHVTILKHITVRKAQNKRECIPTRSTWFMNILISMAPSLAKSDEKSPTIAHCIRAQLVAVFKALKMLP